MENYEDETVLVPPRNLDDLIKELHKVFASDRINVEDVKSLMASYRSNPMDWKKYRKFDTHRLVRIDFTCKL